MPYVRMTTVLDSVIRILITSLWPQAVAREKKTLTKSWIF